MAHAYAEIAFTPAVRAEQERLGSRGIHARQEGGAAHHDTLGPDEAAFIATRDSFYLSSVSETGWPYIQHRGGPAGFLKVLGPRQLGFADFRGNRQYVTLGNLKGDDRVSLFLMDYARRGRLKIFGHARATENPAVLEQLALPGYRAKVERAMLIDVAGFDWNCPQHITERFTMADFETASARLGQRIVELEAELARLRAAGEA
ncbi:MAG: pyridoxamine 5'-phosphate oxidase family protein [Pseudomonadota bacterium]